MTWDILINLTLHKKVKCIKFFKIFYISFVIANYVKIWAKPNAKINSIFSPIITILLINFSKEAILFLIYLLADKDNYLQKQLMTRSEIYTL